MSPFLARRQRFPSVGSTNDVVRAWLADGTAEVCLAVADEQTAGRGRDGRRWVAPPGAALLLSLGFRPTWLEPADAWRLAAVASLAMADAGEAVAGLPAGSIRLKWPNDLAIALGTPGAVRKVAGVLGETEGLGTPDPRVVVGLGINADWASGDFPAERAGRFDGADWADRQLTTGRTVTLVTAAGDEVVHAVGVDTATGALVVEDPANASGERRVLVGEISHVRLADPITAAV